MNFLLLDKIDDVDDGFVATILSSEGHTYARAGARALFATGDPVPRHGNLGSLCVDQELLRHGREACADGVPRRARIDTTNIHDADLGYGTNCGGSMEILVEPIGEQQREVYRDLRSRLSRGEGPFLEHDLATGALSLHDARPGVSSASFVEQIEPPRRLVIFGATPLARQLCTVLREAEFDIHVCDWRESYLDAFTGLNPSHRHLDEIVFDPHACVVIISHSFRRDKAALKMALENRCAFVGMLSSRHRRDIMYEELREEGITRDQLARVSCPVGVDIGGRSDIEIAVSIAVELMRET